MGLWSKIAGAEREIAREWTSNGNGDVVAAAHRGIEALGEIERSHSLSAGEMTWLTNLRSLMRTYLPGGGNYKLGQS